MKGPTIDQVIFTPIIIVLIIIVVTFMLGLICWSIGHHMRKKIRKDEETFAKAEKERQEREALDLQAKYAKEGADRAKKLANLDRHIKGEGEEEP